MTRKLIIEGNAVYEIDEDCMLKKRVAVDEHVKNKREEGSGHEYRKKCDQGTTQGHGRPR